MKVCNICNKSKELILFGIDRKAKDQRRGLCKQCESEKCKSYKKLNKDKIKEYNRRQKKKQADNISDRYVMAQLTKITKCKISELNNMPEIEDLKNLYKQKLQLRREYEASTI